jgi:hypothetical protein
MTDKQPLIRFESNYGLQKVLTRCYERIRLEFGRQLAKQNRTTAWTAGRLVCNLHLQQTGTIGRVVTSLAHVNTPPMATSAWHRNILIRQTAATADGLAPRHDSTGKQLKLGLERRHIDARFRELKCGARQMVLTAAQSRETATTI